MEKYPLLTLSRSAATAIGSYLLVKLTSDTAVALATAATDAIFGVTTELGIDAGRIGDVVTVGIYPVRAGAAIAVGDQVTSDSQGRAVVAVSGNTIAGRAVSAAAAAGDLVYIKF
jgi:hypothetical protein